MILIKLFFIFELTFGYESCEDKLKNIHWPLDCFLALSLKKTGPKSNTYTLLNDWCLLFEEKLLESSPPPSIFSLYLPEKCKQIALKAKNHHIKIKLIKGSFLNSFL